MVREGLSDGQPRVALVSGGLNWGGAITFLCNLGGELVRRRIPVQVLSLENNNQLASDFQQARIPVVCQDDKRCILEDRLTLALQELRRFRPTVVVANLGATSFEVLRYVPAGVFRVGMAQSDDPGVYETVGHYPRHLDAMAAVSETIKRKLRALPGFSAVRVHCLPYGVPMPDEAAALRQFDGPLRILYVGRLGQIQKRVHLFPAIFEQLKASGIPFHWTIAGDGPDEGLLRGMVGNPPAQTVSFTGRLAYREVPALLLQHDVFLLVSDFEGLPLSLLEAMGSGLVPVVSDLPSGIPEVVDETTGKLVAVDNTAGYAEAIIWLHQHRSEMRQLSRSAREKVRREYSVAAMADRWLEALPKAAAPGVVWPETWSIKAPLATRKRLRFSPPGRVLRRLKLRLKHGI